MTVEEEEFLTTMNTEAEEFLAAVTAKGEELLPTDAVLIATKKTKTLLNRMAREVEKSLTRTPSKPLTPLFERLRRCHSLQSDPFVVATCNDLVLCCASKYEQRDYFLCNPCTIQWVPLPPPPRVYFEVAVGFILDDVDNAQQSCRCKVVRIPEPINQKYSFILKVEIFSSETGFDPFVINTNSSSDGGIDHYEGRIIHFGDRPDFVMSRDIVCVGVYGGCLRFITELNLASCTLHAWELEEEHDERAVNRFGNLILKRSMYSLDTQMFDGTERMSYTSIWPIFDPNDEDILYLRNENAGNFKCNIRTREWSKMQVHRLHDKSDVWFQLITLPWWPTPVPRLSQDQHGNIPMEQASS
ncbi:hypothetical protein M0R45_009785 [Rubus argutus]|uniref:F-box protein At3g26010-like beta-propeller domain-containing protein n=1 Tax=Rubus argutus TaxID=59490 RepID=A0AAW1Y8Y9_RUBAR